MKDTGKSAGCSDVTIIESKIFAIGTVQLVKCLPMQA